MEIPRNKPECLIWSFRSKPRERIYFLVLAERQSPGRFFFPLNTKYLNKFAYSNVIFMARGIVKKGKNVDIYLSLELLTSTDFTPNVS